MCARFRGTMRRSSPTRALPVARMRFSPLAVRGMSVVPVCRPLRDHSVSPWRMMKTRGVVMLMGCQGGLSAFFLWEYGSVCKEVVQATGREQSTYLSWRGGCNRRHSPWPMGGFGACLRALRTLAIALAWSCCARTWRTEMTICADADLTKRGAQCRSFSSGAERRRARSQCQSCTTWIR